MIAMNMGRDAGWWLQMGCASRDAFQNVVLNDCATVVQQQVETFYDRDNAGYKRTRTKLVRSLVHSHECLRRCRKRRASATRTDATVRLRPPAACARRGIRRAYSRPH